VIRSYRKIATLLLAVVVIALGLMRFSAFGGAAAPAVDPCPLAACIFDDGTTDD
jgi:hypothetical protein